MPAYSTVVRLLEFDHDQRQRWISVWNATNVRYFEDSRTQPLQLLPGDDNIRPLAEQPLLLLMLALYDSGGNQLRTNRGLDQTLLYESLLKQFIEREHLKSADFRSLGSVQRTSEIDADLERLGAAAIGCSTGGASTFGRPNSMRTLHSEARTNDAPRLGPHPPSS